MNDRPSMEGPPRRPLIGLALCFASGMAAGLLLRVEGDALWPVAAALALLAWAASRMGRPTASRLALFAAVVVLGCLRAILQADGVSGRDLCRQMRREAEHLRLAGTVGDDPVREEDGSWTFLLQAEGVNRDGSWRRTGSRVEVRLLGPATSAGPNPGSRLRYGDRLVLSGPVQHRAHPSPDRRYRMRAHPDGIERWSAPASGSLMRWVYEQRRRCEAVLMRGHDPGSVSSAISRTMLLGIRNDLPPEVRDEFLITGTIHVLAISGSHLAVMAGLVWAVLRLAGLRKPAWIFALAPILTLYLLATGMAPSSLRAWMMAMVYGLAPCFGRRPDIATALGLSALLILAIDPSSLVNPGFLFSFATVAGLLAWAPVLERRIGGWMESGSRLESAAGRLGNWWSRRKRAFATLAAVSIAAWVASIPLSIYYSNILSFVALPANLAVVPWAGLILLTGCLTLVASAVSPAAADVFNHANRFFIDRLVGFNDAMAGLPGSHLCLPSPPAGGVLVLYALLAALLLLRGRPRLALAGAVLAAGLSTAMIAAKNRHVRLLVPPSTTGAFALLDLPGRGDILLSASREALGPSVVRFLRAHGVDRLAAVALPRPVSDDAGALPCLLSRMPVNEIWLPAGMDRAPAWRMIRRTLPSRIRVRALGAGDSFEPMEGVRVTVLHPDPGAAVGRIADAELVFCVRAGEARVWWMGRLPGATADRIPSGDRTGSALLIRETSVSPAIRDMTARLIPALAIQFSDPFETDQSQADDWRDAFDGSRTRFVRTDPGGSWRVDWGPLAGPARRNGAPGAGEPPRAVRIPRRGP